MVDGIVPVSWLFSKRLTKYGQDHRSETRERLSLQGQLVQVDQLGGRSDAGWNGSRQLIGV